MTKAKICGLITPETVQAALDGGAAYIGFNFFLKSPRYIDPEGAAALARAVRGSAQVVAVTVDPDNALVEQLMATLAPDIVQLHGKESPMRVAEIGRLTGALTMKAVPVATVHDLDEAKAYDGAADHLMLDAKAPEGATLPGGNGVAFDWTITAGRRFNRPWFLAGGLDPWNVADAISASGAPIVDVSSGVERGPGYKDPRLITAFLDAVRRA